MTEAAPGYVLRLELEPLDVLFFGGGRPFGPTSRVVSGPPTPQTTAGAVRTWLLERTGADLKRLGESIRNGADFASATEEQGTDTARVGRLTIRGPWFTSHGERLVPTPSTVHVVDDGATGSEPRLDRLDPLSPSTEVPGWPEGEAAGRPLWRRSPTPSKPRNGYLLPAALERFLSGRTPLPGDVVDEDQVFRIERRHGIGMNSRGNTAREGLIYRIDVLRLTSGVRIEVELVGSKDDLTVCPSGETTIALGGEGRRVVARPRTPTAPELPTADREANRGDGALILLTTPGLFGAAQPQALELTAASVPGKLPVSGWDLALGGPKPTRFAAPAGSVYFLTPGSRPPGGGTLCSGEDGKVGWGAFVQGEWSYA